MEKAVYVVKLIYDDLDSTLSDMCFDNIIKTQFVFYMDQAKCFGEVFEPLPENGKVVLIMFLNKNDNKLLNESDVLKSDLLRL